MTLPSPARNEDAMSEAVDFKILELLASKICHDLISPIGAINNGIEILDEMGPDAGKDVTDLIAFSAHQASAKLQAYRMAYGVGGADSSIKAEDVHKAIESVISKEKKITQDWDPHAPLGMEEPPAGFCKMLIAAILLAMECLPKGGEISVAASDDNSTIITAKGDDAAPREQIEDVLGMKIPLQNIEPKHMHAYICALLSQNYGFTLGFSETGDGVVNIKLSA